MEGSNDSYYCDHDCISSIYIVYLPIAAQQTFAPYVLRQHQQDVARCRHGGNGGTHDARCQWPDVADTSDSSGDINVLSAGDGIPQGTLGIQVLAMEIQGQDQEEMLAALYVVTEEKK